MTRSRTLSVCLIFLSVAACNTQEKTATVNKAAEITTIPVKTTEQKPTIVKTRPVMNLSIGNLPVEHQISDDNFLNIDEKFKEKDNTLFKNLNKSQVKPGINLSGNLITDKDKVANKEYLDSVEGMQINIEGRFN